MPVHSHCSVIQIAMTSHSKLWESPEISTCYLYTVL